MTERLDQGEEARKDGRKDGREAETVFIKCGMFLNALLRTVCFDSQAVSGRCETVF